MAEQLTIKTSAGPVAALIDRTRGVLQVNVPLLPGKRFGMFAVYADGGLSLFKAALCSFVDSKLDGAAPDENIGASMPGCIVAGTGPTIAAKAAIASDQAIEPEPA